MGIVKLLFSTSTESGKVSKSCTSTSVHAKANWLEDLTRKFHEEIISPCSARTVGAVKDNKNIQVGVYSCLPQYLFILQGETCPQESQGRADKCCAEQVAGYFCSYWQAR